MSVLPLDSVCKFCLNEQLEMRNGCSGFAPHPVEPVAPFEPQDKKRLHRQLAM